MDFILAYSIFVGLIFLILDDLCHKDVQGNEQKDISRAAYFKVFIISKRSN